LRHKRGEHIEAVKKILSVTSSEKQRAVLNAVFSKLFSVSIIQSLFTVYISFAF